MNVLSVHVDRVRHVSGLRTGMTMLLALSVYQLIVTEKLPTTSDAVPLLGITLTLIFLQLILGLYLALYSASEILSLYIRT